jgi:hypothetical protein
MLTVASYFDESGKFKDHAVVTFGGVACNAANMSPFFEEWARCLYVNGLPTLTMKEALRHRYPLSEKNPALGAEARTEALLPFIAAIRKHLWIISGIALDVAAFNGMPSHYHELFGKDPFFTAFLRQLLEILEITHAEDKLTMICDDEEQMALPMYKLYRRVKLIHPEARNKLKALTFGDDEWMHGLQAADLVSSIIRMEAGKRFLKTPYDYEKLFAELTKQPNRDAGESIWGCTIGFIDRKMLDGLVEAMKKEKILKKSK